jgi:hypothetical protein
MLAYNKIVNLNALTDATFETTAEYCAKYRIFVLPDVGKINSYHNFSIIISS